MKYYTRLLDITAQDFCLVSVFCMNFFPSVTKDTTTVQHTKSRFVSLIKIQKYILEIGHGRIERRELIRRQHFSVVRKARKVTIETARKFVIRAYRRMPSSFVFIGIICKMCSLSEDGK